MEKEAAPAELDRSSHCYMRTPIAINVADITPVDPSHTVKRGAPLESWETWNAERLSDEALSVTIWKQQKST